MTSESDKRLRYRLVRAMDRIAIKRACEALARRSRTPGGVYIVLDEPPAGDEPSGGKASLREILRGRRTILYVGGSSDLKTRSLHLASGFLGTNHRHCFVQFHRRELLLEPARERLTLLLMPFSPHHCLEEFILSAHEETWGAYPVGNRRRATRSSAHDQERPVEVTAGLLMNRARGGG